MSLSHHEDVVIQEVGRTIYKYLKVYNSVLVDILNIQFVQN